VLLLVLPGEITRWRLLRLAVRIVLRVGGLPTRVEGLVNAPGGPCVYVANHASYLDSMLLAAVLPCPFSFVAKGELRRNLLVRLPLGRIGTVFVERFEREKSVAATRKLTAVAGAGRALLFFAEGTFTRAAGLLPFRMGAFDVAARGNLPVVPVAIRGTRSALRSGSWFFRRSPLAVVVGDPILPERVGDGAAGQSWGAAVRLRDRTRSWMLQHCGEPDLAHERAELLVSGAAAEKP